MEAACARLSTVVSLAPRNEAQDRSARSNRVDVTRTWSNREPRSSAPVKSKFERQAPEKSVKPSLAFANDVMCPWGKLKLYWLSDGKNVVSGFVAESEDDVQLK